MDLSAFGSLLVFFVLSIATASSGAFFRPGPWYDTINRPSWNPPRWLFRPAWTVMYTLMAVAGWLTWEAAGTGEAALPLGLFVAQLVANALWSALFFGLKRMDLALAEVLVFWALILATLLAMRPVSPEAATLMIPYLLWVTFASYLTFTLWRLNRAPAADGGAAS